MDRRRSPRISTKLPAQVWGVDAHSLPFIQVATLANISSTGAEVHGLRRQVQPGEIVELFYSGQKAQFRVVWAGILGSRREGRLGLEIVATNVAPWDLELPQCPGLWLTADPPAGPPC